jgi:hypothetical protein
LLGRNASSDGSGFKNYLERQLEQSKLKKRDITFEELYQYKQIHLEIVACDLKNPDHPPIIFSPKENKSTSISIAVRASISLPGFFTPVRMGNWELGDGGFKLNFPIENFYEQAKKEDCALIGVRFKKSQRSFNSSNSRQVVLKGYDLFTSNSSKVPDEIRSYLKCQIIEIDDDLGCNPLDFNLSKEQLLKLRKAGEEVARKQLEELQNRLTEVKSRRYSQLPPSIRKSVEEAQRWFSYEAIPRIEDYCKRTLSLDKFRNLEIDERKTKLFYWEVEKYLVRISESLLAQRYDLLQYKLLRPSLSNLDVYLEILDLIKREIPEYLMAKQEVKERIDYLKEKIIQQFSNP